MDTIIYAQLACEFGMDIDTYIEYEERTNVEQAPKLQKLDFAGRISPSNKSKIKPTVHDYFFPGLFKPREDASLSMHAKIALESPFKPGVWIRGIVIGGPPDPKSKRRGVTARVQIRGFSPISVIFNRDNYGEEWFEFY